MKLLYGTTNQAKLISMQRVTKKIGIEIFGLNDLYKIPEFQNIQLPDVDETGKNPLENATIKAKAYYELLKIPVFSCDTGLYFEDVEEKEEATRLIEEDLKGQMNENIELIYKNHNYYVEVEQIEAKFDIASSVDYAFGIAKSGDFVKDVKDYITVFWKRMVSTLSDVRQVYCKHERICKICKRKIAHGCCRFFKIRRTSQ